MAIGSVSYAPRSRSFPALIRLSATVGAVEFVAGFIYPAVALNLEARGASPALIGGQAATIGLGLMLSPLLVPWLCAKLGAVRLGIANIWAASLALLGFGLVDAIGLWFGLSLLFGITINIWYVQSETWLNQVAQDDCRGRMVGLVSGLREGANACGPMLIPLLGWAGAAPYAILALVVASAGIGLRRLRAHVEQPGTPKIRDMLRTARAIPVLLLAVAISGYFSGGVLPLWMIYALDRGATTDQAALTLALIVAGNVALQLPIGWLADRLPRALVLAGCALGASLGAALLPALDLTSWLAWPYLLVWGALSFAVYTVALVLIGQDLPPDRLMMATAAFGVMWGAGALLGSAATGQIMAWLGPLGLPGSLALAYALLFVTAIAPARIVGPVAIERAIVTGRIQRSTG